jgi:hypothetical protein
MAYRAKRQTSRTIVTEAKRIADDPKRRHDAPGEVDVDARRERKVSSSADGAKPLTPHGPLQGLSGGSSRSELVNNT